MSMMISLSKKEKELAIRLESCIREYGISHVDAILRYLDASHKLYKLMLMEANDDCDDDRILHLKKNRDNIVKWGLLREYKRQNAARA